MHNRRPQYSKLKPEILVLCKPPSGIHAAIDRFVATYARAVQAFGWDLIPQNICCQEAEGLHIMRVNSHCTLKNSMYIHPSSLNVDRKLVYLRRLSGALRLPGVTSS